MKATPSSKENYRENLKLAILHESFDTWVSSFLVEIKETIKRNGSIYIFGNGGSAANATHIANDFTYAYQNKKISASIEAICTNQAVITCLANDIGYDNIYSYQLNNKASSGDLLVALSGSGNSPNILNALQFGIDKKVRTLGIFGYDGGKASKLVDSLIHIDCNDMQVAEDMQVIIAHAALRAALQ